jgi:DNA helicase-2/ATP-dependent DNA helicase PcrA
MDTSIEGQSRTANVEELVDSIKLFVEEKHAEQMEDLQAEGEIAEGVELTASDLPLVTLGDYLENASLLSAVDVSDEESSNKIALMTVHSSKGLEFPYVFVAGMEENIFPSGGFMASETEIEEERRLFYVAMTRAKKVLQLSFASTRLRNGKHESNSPSRFVKEVDSQYIANPLSLLSDDEDDKPKHSFGGWGKYSRPQVERRPTPTQPVRRPEPPRRSEPVPVRRPQSVPVRVPDAEFEPTPILKLRAGQRIEHNRFGYGKILEISGSVSDLKAKIAFDEHGEKILILKYAKIRAVDLENK